MTATTMQACTVRRYGGPEVVRLERMPKPHPRADEMLVRVVATTVTAGDWRVRTLETPAGFGLLARLAIGIRGPRSPILGSELAGIVEAVGPDVGRFTPGDAVVAATGVKGGAHGEYVAIPASGCIVRKPDGLSFEEAAAIPFGGITALHFLRKARLRGGERVAVVGASGNVGTWLVQLAKREGAHVTAVTSARNRDLVLSLGADEFVDYATERFDAGRTFDIIADAAGTVAPGRAFRALRPGGRLLLVAGSLAGMLFAPARAAARGKRAVAGVAWERAELLQELVDLAAARTVRAVVDRHYDLSEMAQAHAYVATRRKRGSVVVRVTEPRSDKVIP